MLPQFQRPSAGVAFVHGVIMVLPDSFLEAVALDEPHGVVRAAVSVTPQAEDRHDSRMFQPAGDLGLDEK
jgi:hypothetical protein